MQNVNQGEFSMKWFNFYKVFYLRIVVCIRILVTLFTFFGGTYFDFFKMLFQGDLYFWDVALIGISLLSELLVTVMMVYLCVKLDQFTSRAYKINIAFIILFAISITLNRVSATYYAPTGNMLATLIAGLIASAIWIIPNLIYFSKRKRLFTQKQSYPINKEDEIDKSSSIIDENMKQYANIMFGESTEGSSSIKKSIQTKSKKISLPGIICIIIAITFLGFYAYFYLFDSNPKTETSEITSSEVWDALDDLAKLYDFESAVEFVDSIEEDTGEDLYEYTAQERYEYIASEYFGLTPYNEAIGLTDPYNNTIIQNLLDYHKYVYAACEESIENYSE